MVAINKSHKIDLAEYVRKRAAIYARVSTEKQEEEGTSLKTQVEDCLNYCKEHGYIVSESHIYRDVHTGAEYRERPQLTLLREAIRHKEVDVVVIYDVDRLSRVQIHLAVLIDEAQHAGVTIEFVKRVFDDTPIGQFIRSAISFVSEVERAKIIERTERGKLDRVKSGKLMPGCKALYGYQYIDPDKTAYVLHPEESKVVKTIFTMAKDGHSIRSIALHLTSEGIKPPKRKERWGHWTIVRILKNPAYTGEAVAFKYRFSKATNYRKEERPHEEQIPLPSGVIPPIIDRETFEVIQERLRLNKEMAARNNKAPEESLLRGGFARCGYCGHTMIVVRKNRKKSNQPEKRNDRLSYQCGKNVQVDREMRCTHGFEVHLLDAIVWKHITEVVQNPSHIIQEIETRRQADPTADDLDAIDRTLKKLEQEQKNLLANLRVLDPIYAKHIQVELNQLAEQQRRLERERNEVLEQRKEWQVEQEKLDDFLKWCTNFAAKLGKHTYAEMRNACEVLGVKVLVWRADHNPRYKIEMLPSFVVQTS